MIAVNRQTTGLVLLFMLRRTSLNALQVERKGYENSKDHDPNGHSVSFLL